MTPAYCTTSGAAKSSGRNLAVVTWRSDARPRLSLLREPARTQWSAQPGSALQPNSAADGGQWLCNGQPVFASPGGKIRPTRPNKSHV
jgi:hypothetical protein